MKVKEFVGDLKLHAKKKQVVTAFASFFDAHLNYYQSWTSMHKNKLTEVALLRITDLMNAMKTELTELKAGEVLMPGTFGRVHQAWRDLSDNIESAELKTEENQRDDTIDGKPDEGSQGLERLQGVLERVERNGSKTTRNESQGERQKIGER